MNHVRFDALTRQAGSLDRKSALKLLGGSVAVLAAARPLVGEAKKNCKKKCNRKADRKCGKVEKACESFIDETCELPPAECLEARDCCKHLATCKGTQFFDCLADAVASSPL